MNLQEYRASAVGCPFCGGIINLDATIDTGDFILNRPVSCISCHKKWWEVYEITRVVERY